MYIFSQLTRTLFFSPLTQFLCLLESVAYVLSLELCYVHISVKYLHVLIHMLICFIGKSTDELLGTWQREANFALGARQKGVHLELFKNVGERKVYSLFCFGFY